MTSVGIFDSGIGGLGVARAFLRLEPQARVFYIADWAYCPYGGRPNEEIRERARALARELVEERGCGIVCVACNSASGVALETIREDHPTIPIVGMEPAIKPAAACTRSGVVGVLATAHTLAGDLFHNTTERWANNVRVIPTVGDGFVELAERGPAALETPEARATVERVLSPLLAENCDTIVLGCTHYPLLLPLLQRVAPQVTFIDPALAVAKRIQTLYKEFQP